MIGDENCTVGKTKANEEAEEDEGALAEEEEEVGSQEMARLWQEMRSSFWAPILE